MPSTPSSPSSSDLASLALLAYGSHSLPTQAPAGGVDLSLPVMAAAALTTGSDDTGTDDTMMGAAMENLKENTGENHVTCVL